MPQQTALPSSQAVPLLCAWVTYMLAAAGVRALVVEGEALSIYRLQSTRSSVVVDILVDPNSSTYACEVIGNSGWRERTNSFITKQIGFHSRTFCHEAWGCPEFG